MKKCSFIFLLVLITSTLLNVQSLYAQTITIQEAKTKALDETVTVKGIAICGNEMGSIRYIMDGTAGIAIYHPSGVGTDLKRGDEIEITGQLSEFNDLMQIVEGTNAGDVFEYTILSSNNPVPEPAVMTLTDAYDEAYEGQLIKFEAVLFGETGDFAGNTNYTITDGSVTQALRISSSTGIAGSPIPADKTDVVGIMGQYKDTYQLLPRDKEDLGLTVDPPAGLLSIKEAKSKPYGTNVTVKGILLNGDELGSIRYIMDETAGIAIYHPSGVGNDTERGDSILITGEFNHFNELGQIVEGAGEFSYEVLNSDNTLPEPKALSFTDGYMEDYEGQLVKFTNVTFEETGSFAGNTNYTLNDGSSTGALRVSSTTDIVGAAIPTEPLDAIGIMGQYKEDYQLLPRDKKDLGLDGGGTTGDLISIKEARTKGQNATVYVEGIVTNDDELGSVRYIQDATAGIGIYAPSANSSIKPGNIIRIKGQLDDYNGLLEIKDAGDFSVEVISTGNELPAPIEMTADKLNTEKYEGMLVKVKAATFLDSGSFGTGSSNYDIMADGDDYEVRVYQNTDIGGTPIPTEAINIIGIMSQYAPDDPIGGYQLLPRGLSDFEYLNSQPIFTTPLIQTNITKTSFTVSFETLKDGNASINYGLTDALELGSAKDDNFSMSHSVDLSGLEAGQVYYVQAISESPEGDASTSAMHRMATVSNSSGDIIVYFNQPVDNSVSSGTDALFIYQELPDTIINYFNRAKYSIDICMYTLDNNDGLVDALNAAVDKGIKVRAVGDSEAGTGATNNSWFSLKADKVKRPSGLYGIMHNKFIVIDADSDDPNDPIVWTGATNFTENQMKKDPNNVIIIQDQSLARAYTIEFEEMFNGKFGDEKADNTPKEFLINGKRVELFFSPSDQINTAIRNTIRTADENIYFGILAFTRNDIAYAFSDEIDEGTEVKGIMDSNDGDYASTHDILDDEMGNNLLVNPTGIFHHKYIIVDEGTNSDPIVLTGSHNWTNSAQYRNDENTVIVHDGTIANIYYQEFSKRFEEISNWVFVDEEEHNWEIIAYPNPVKETLFILYNTTEQAEDLHIQLMNINGQLIKDWTVDNATRGQLKEDISRLNNGMYLLNINGQTEKIVISK